MTPRNLTLSKKGRYCRVYPGGSFPDYFETCGEGVLAGYFELVEV